MRVLTLILVVCMFAVPGSAQNYEFYNKQLTPEQQKQAIYLEKHIMATCCFGGPVYMHGRNQRTEEEKITIRRLLLEGKSIDQILDYFRNSLDPRTGKPYGNRILASPKASETVGKVSYWMVIGFSAIGLALLALALHRLRRRQPAQTEAVELSEETLKKIESEISRFS